MRPRGISARRRRSSRCADGCEHGAWMSRPTASSSSSRLGCARPRGHAGRRGPATDAVLRGSSPEAAGVPADDVELVHACEVCGARQAGRPSLPAQPRRAAPWCADVAGLGRRGRRGGRHTASGGRRHRSAVARLRRGDRPGGLRHEERAALAGLFLRRRPIARATLWARNPRSCARGAHRRSSSGRRLARLDAWLRRRCRPGRAERSRARARPARRSGSTTSRARQSRRVDRRPRLRGRGRPTDGRCGPTDTRARAGQRPYSGDVRSVIILGSSGSIGTQALDVIRANPRRFDVVGLAVGSNRALLAEQAEEFHVEHTAVGIDEAVQLVTRGRRRRRANGITGSVGLAPTLATLERGTTLALATRTRSSSAATSSPDSLGPDRSSRSTPSTRRSRRRCDRHRRRGAPARAHRVRGPVRGRRRSELAEVTLPRRSRTPPGTWASSSRRTRRRS